MPCRLAYELVLWRHLLKIPPFQMCLSLYQVNRSQATLLYIDSMDKLRTGPGLVFHSPHYIIYKGTVRYSAGSHKVVPARLPQRVKRHRFL